MPKARTSVFLVWTGARLVTDNGKAVLGSTSKTKGYNKPEIVPSRSMVEPDPPSGPDIVIRKS